MNEETKAAPTPAAPAQVAEKPQNTAIAKPSSVRDWLKSDSFKGEIAKALPSVCTADRFMRFALTSLQRVPALEKCSQPSVLRCFLQLAELGIEADGRRAHLIPYGQECTLILDYKGLIELVRRSGEVASLRAETVCEAERETFSWHNGEIEHRINWLEPRGEILAVYAVCQLKSGETQSAVMTKAEVEKIRTASKAGSSGPWKDHWGEMAKKTVIRRLCKMLPLATEVQEALLRDDDAPAAIPGRGESKAKMPEAETIIEAQ